MKVSGWTHPEMVKRYVSSVADREAIKAQRGLHASEDAAREAARRSEGRLRLCRSSERPTRSLGATSTHHSKIHRRDLRSRHGKQEGRADAPAWVVEIGRTDVEITVRDGKRLMGTITLSRAGIRAD